MTPAFALRALHLTAVWCALAFGLLFVAHQAWLALDRVIAAVL